MDERLFELEGAVTTLLNQVQELTEASTKADRKARKAGATSCECKKHVLDDVLRRLAVLEATSCREADPLFATPEEEIAQIRAEIKKMEERLAAKEEEREERLAECEKHTHDVRHRYIPEVKSYVAAILGPSMKAADQAVKSRLNIYTIHTSLGNLRTQVKNLE